MKKIFSIILFLSVISCGFALTKMQVYINGDNGAWNEPVEEIDSIKYTRDTIEIDDDVEDKKYLIHFQGPNGYIKTDTLAFGEMPKYQPVAYYTNYTYNNCVTHYFKHWEPAITKVRGNASYYAVYESIGSELERIYIDYKDSIILKVFPDDFFSASYRYEDTAPQNVPTKPNNFHYKYTFKEWKGSMTYGCRGCDNWSGEAYTSDGLQAGIYQIYKEVLDSTLIQYDIILKYDGQSATVKSFFDYKPTPSVFSPTLQDWVDVTWVQDLSLVEHDTIIYTASFKDIAKRAEVTLPAPFHINDSTIIYFSKGNLQYNAGDGNTHKTADSTARGTWRFAERQYDYVGEENIGKDSTYNGWVDLFEWGSSGWKGNHDHKYYVALDTAQCRNADWGVYNAISNGGDEPGLWRTLSFQEWAYLLNRSNWGFAKIGENSTLCLVIFPSEFITPDTMNIVYASTSDKNDFFESSGLIGYGPGITDSNTNTFTDEEFEELEARGVVALPFAGHVGGDYSSSNEFNEYGNIWTSNHYYNSAYEIYFGKIVSSRDVGIYAKKSVRLVHVVE